MAYYPIYQKYFTQFSEVPERIKKKENAKVRCYLRALCTFALTTDTSYDSMCIQRNNQEAIHTIRMLIEACFNAYAFLIYKDKDAFLNKFFKGEDFNKLTLNGKKLTTNTIKEYIEKDYPSISRIYEDTNRYIHFGNYYCLGVEADLDEETKQILYSSQQEGLIGDYAEMRHKENREWVWQIVEIINDILLEIMDRIVKEIEPAKEIAGLDKINLNDLQRVQEHHKVT